MADNISGNNSEYETEEELADNISDNNSEYETEVDSADKTYDDSSKYETEKDSADNTSINSSGNNGINPIETQIVPSQWSNFHNWPPYKRI